MRHLLQRRAPRRATSVGLVALALTAAATASAYPGPLAGLRSHAGEGDPTSKALADPEKSEPTSKAHDAAARKPRYLALARLGVRASGATLLDSTLSVRIKSRRKVKLSLAVVEGKTVRASARAFSFKQGTRTLTRKLTRTPTGTTLKLRVTATRAGKRARKTIPLKVMTSPLAPRLPPQPANPGPTVPPPPVVPGLPQAGISLTSSTVAENQPAGTVLGTLSTSPGSGHTYALVAGAGASDNAQFRIAGDKLETAQPLDFEGGATRSIRIRSTDSAGAVLEQQFTIIVTNVNEAPVADDESFAGAQRAVGNTAFVGDDPSDGAPDPPGPQKTITADLLAGDSDPDSGTSLVLTAETKQTNDGGSVTIEPDGDFTYRPATGTSCADHSDFFDYTLSDGSLTDVGRVTIEVQDCVWYIDAAAAGGGDGRSHAPFNSLASVAGAGGADDVDAAGQTLFVYDGSYTGGLPLESTQKLFSQRHGLSVPDGGAGNLTLEPALPAGASSTISGGLALASGNTIQGIHLGDAAGAALSGTSVGSAVMNTETSGAINNATGRAVNIATGALNMAFTGVSSSASPTNAITLAGTSGTFSAAGGTLQNATGADVSLNGDSTNFTYDGQISDDVGQLVSISGQTGGTKDFNGQITDGGDGDGSGISLSSNNGATIRFDGGLTLSTGANPAFAATGGGTVNVTGSTNTVDTTTGTAVNVASTTIGAGGLTFRSVSSNGAANGVVLNNTGTSGGLTVTGNGGTCASVATCTGGTIQNATVGVSMTNTRSPSFDRLFVSNTTGSGVKGTQVTNFTFTNGKIATSGTGGGVDTSNIAFNTLSTATENNLSGTVTITGNTLTNAHHHGVDIFSYSGTITNATISNNTLTSYTTTGGGGTNSVGSGIRFIAFGSAGGVASITKATIDSNIVNNFPGAVGIQVQCGQAGGAAAPATSCGTAGSATNKVAITSNQINKPGNGATVKTGAEGLIALVNGAGQGNFDISSNNVQATTGTSISSSAFGNANVTETITNNTVVSNNIFGSQGIGIGTSTTGGFATNSPHLTATITGNNVSRSDGNGILAVARDSQAGQLDVSIKNNTVGASLSGVRPGIRVDAGASSGDNDVCLDISGNTSAGSGGTQGIGLRKQGTVTTTNAFGVEGMAATSSPGVETFVNGQNPAGGGTLLISATSGFSNCSTAP